MSDVPALVRRAVASLPLYDPERANVLIDVSDSTNLWGMPPAGAAVLREIASRVVAGYPSAYADELAPSIRRYLALPDTGVVTGCGSDDVIDSTMRAFGEPGEAIAFSTPTFSMVPALARLNGLRNVPVPFGAGFDLDAQRLVEARAKITYVCAPNNPTGTSVSRAAVEYVVERAAGVVMIDEAYAEFAPATFERLALKSDRVLIVRTFSKAFGLAGLRVGYAVGAPPLTDAVARARGPYKVNTVAERAAMAVLDDTADGLRWVRTQAKLAMEIREQVASALATRGYSPIPSNTNFLFLPTRDAGALAQRAVTRGVVVKRMEGLDRTAPELAASDGKGLRLGVGPWDIMERVIEALT